MYFNTNSYAQYGIYDASIGNCYSSFITITITKLLVCAVDLHYPESYFQHFMIM